MFWGFDKENMVIVKMQGSLLYQYKVVKREISKINEVRHVSYSDAPNTEWYNSACIDKWKNIEHGYHVCIGFDEVGYDYAKTMGFEMVEGRFFSDKYLTDANNKIVINEAAVAALDLENYDFSKGSKSLIRATEGTIIDRIPPRVKIRKKALLELPHIMVLIDDSEKSVIEITALRFVNSSNFKVSNI